MVHPKHILVVDHDGDVRQVISELLLDRGYRVSLAKDGPAMRAFLETSDTVDVIVLDATTAEAAEAKLAILARDRGIRLVMISGHPAVMKRFHDRADQLLRKPFGSDELERAVRYALASDVRGQRGEDPV